MFKKELENYTELLNTMEEVHAELVSEAEAAKRTEYLTDCQNAAMLIGNALEQDEQDHPDMYKGASEVVKDLEEYCEKLYQVSLLESVSRENRGILNASTKQIRKGLEALPLRFKVVFFPYKAEMWDSLESIYLAAKEDERCEVKVVPVPYMEYQNQTGKWESRYDGGRFEGTEVTFYGDYHLEEELPDVGYIHYPYDDANYVTRLKEEYFSRNLKKYVGTLVYTPYYVTGGIMSREHLRLPAYEFADYIVLQSENMKESCKGMPYYDKILPFGSAKLDSVIRKCREGGKIPADWVEFIHGRRTLMLNTSLNQFLSDNELSIMKLEYIWDYFKEHQEIALIWRPHPLLKSTIKSMRPELLEKYEAVEERFIREKIGIYDTTPDVENTVAIADGYIGSDASSVLNMFGVAGKPIFIFRASMDGPLTEEEQRTPACNCAAVVGDQLFLLTEGSANLYSISMEEIEKAGKNTVDDSVEIRKYLTLPAMTPYSLPYHIMVPIDSTLYFAPLFAHDFISYQPGLNFIKELGNFREFDELWFTGFIPTKTSLYYYSEQTIQIYEYRIGQQEWIAHPDWLDALWQDVQKVSSMPCIACWAYDDVHGKLFLSNGVNNNLLEVEEGKNECRLWRVGTPGSQIVCLTAGKDGVWMINLRNDRVILLAPYSSLNKPETYKVFTVPDSYSYPIPPYQSSWTGPYAGAQKFEVGGYLILFSAFCEQILRLQISTGEWDVIGDEYIAGSRIPTNYYHPDKAYVGAYTVIRKLEPFTEDGRFILQKCGDLQMTVLDVTSDSGETFTPKYGEEEFEAFRIPEAGFGRHRQFETFAMRENRQFPMEYFLQQFAKHGYAFLKETQIKAYANLGANLDGTAGQKTHAYIISKT